MEIKLKARLSAYSRFPKVSCNNDPSDCDAEVVTKEDIDSLFDSVTASTTTVKATVSNSKCNSEIVSAADIDSLFDSVRKWFVYV